MRRVVMDSNAVDPIMDLPGAYEIARAAVRAGQLVMLYTHVNIEELAAVPDLDRRSRLLLTLIDLGQLVPTGAFALDVSRLGFARLFDDVDVLEALRSGNIDHTRDALIASTALVEKCALVTSDIRLAGRAQVRGIEVLTSLNLLAGLGFHPVAA